MEFFSATGTITRPMLSRRPQSHLVPVIDRYCICSKSAAKSRLKVEVLFGSAPAKRR
jgi:hypothetical protein